MSVGIRDKNGSARLASAMHRSGHPKLGLAADAGKIFFWRGNKRTPRSHKIPTLDISLATFLQHKINLSTCQEIKSTRRRWHRGMLVSVPLPLRSQSSSFVLWSDAQLTNNMNRHADEAPFLCEDTCGDMEAFVDMVSRRREGVGLGHQRHGHRTNESKC